MFGRRSSSADARDAALLDEVDRALTTGEATGSSRLWLSLARSVPRADLAYESALRGELAAAAADVHGRGARRTRRASLVTLPRRRLLIAVAIALFVVPVGAAVAGGTIPNVIPWIITKPISGLVTQLTPIKNVASDDQLQRMLSFPLWVPSYMPCAGPNQRVYDAAPERATLVYQCASITELSADQIVRPVADAGTLHEVSVQGQPALYYESTVVMPGSDIASTGRSVIVSLGGTTITVTMLPEHTRAGVRELQEQDLIQIAASLRRVSAP